MVDRHLVPSRLSRGREASSVVMSNCVVSGMVGYPRGLELAVSALTWFQTVP